MKLDLNKLIIGVLILIIVLGTSCSPSNQLRRAERLIRKAEAKGAQWSNVSVTDTVWRVDTVRITGGRFDTLVKYSTDTITVTKDKVVTKIKITPGKTVYVETKCPDKVVIKRVPYTVTKTTTKTIKAGYSLFQIIGGIIFGIVLGALLGKLLWK